MYMLLVVLRQAIEKKSLYSIVELLARVWPFPQEAVWLSDPVYTKRCVVDRAL